MLFEVINPSDPYTCIADDIKIAQAAILVLGDGIYGLKCIDDGEDYSVCLLFADEKTAEAILKDIFGNFEKYLKDNKVEIADCLESFWCGSVAERNIYDELMKVLPNDERINKKKELHNKRRSSLNNIGEVAWQLADQFREI